MLQMAEQLSKATMFIPPELHGKPADILALMVRARGMDLALGIVWDELYATADGDVGRSARLVRALIRRAGHRIDYVEHDKFHAVALLTMADGTKHEISFTIQEAKERGYTDPSYPYVSYWEKQPEEMLIARVTTRAATWHCPEVLLGMGADLRMHEEDSQTASQVVAVREERRAQVVQTLRLIQLAELQLNGAVRLNVLRQLFMECRGALLLDFDVDGHGETSVRHVLVDAMKAADTLAKEQSAGILDPADPDDGPKTVDDLRGLLEAETQAAEQPQPDTHPDEEGEPARATADKSHEETTPTEAAPKTPPKKTPRKKTAKKTASSPQDAAAAPDGAPAPAKPRRARKAAAKSAQPQGAPTTTNPAARPAARPATRPPGRAENTELPCGCLVDHIIATSRHADSCADRKKAQQ